MARKKLRLPSPSPPPRTPPEREDSSSDDEAEAEATATQKAPQIPKPQASDAADAESSDGGDEEESSDSEADANAFKLRQVAPSTRKPSESDEEDGSSSESPEPIIQKKARGKKPKAEAAAGKKRQIAESTPSGGKAKKAKADVEKPGKAPPSVPNASSKGGKKQREKAVPDRSPSKPAVRRWTIEDEIKILEAIVSHVKDNGTQPSTGQLIAAVGDSLEWKKCSYTEMYEKVRSLKQRHKKAATAGTLPGNEDDLRKFNLSEAVWGKSAEEVAAALTISQNDAASSKSNKGQINKEKANEAATTDTPVKSKKRGNHKEELEGDAKAADTAKENTNTATQNGGTLVRSKSGKPDEEGKHGDAESLGPKEAATTDTHEEKMDIDPNMGKRLDELQNLYPNLASYVESIQAQHPCGKTLDRVFKFIADAKASALEAKIKKQRVAEMKMDIRRADTKKEVANMFIGLLN